MYRTGIENHDRQRLGEYVRIIGSNLASAVSSAHVTVSDELCK